MQEIVVFVFAIVVLVGVVSLWNKLLEVQSSLDRIVPKRDGHVVAVSAAMEHPKLSKVEVEGLIFEQLKQDPKAKNTSRQDVRSVMAQLALIYGKLTPEEHIAQVRDMRNWN